MLVYFLKLFAVVVLVLFQYSFLNHAFAGYNVPSIILTAVVVYVVNNDFNKSWPWVIFIGVLADIFSFSVIGKNVIIFIIAAYLTSFLSRGFLLSQNEKRVGVVFFLLFVITVFYNFSNIIWGDEFSLMNIIHLRSYFWVFLRIIFLQTCFNLLVFYIINSFLEKIDRNILFHNKSSF
ncbi:hypothetical protein ACFL08_01385 [Patescibacteria group bacterium]